MMRKFFLLTGIVFFCSITRAQKSIEGLINAEKSFAAYSVAHGIKDAFLKFADSTGIVFDQGKPVNAIGTWGKREKRPGILNWRPQFAAISNSKDFGFTSGPWTFTLSDSIVARGQYSTVWHIDKNGEWKFLIDLGVNNTPAELDTFVVVDKRKSKKSSQRSLIEAEKKLNSESFDSSFHAYVTVETPFRMQMKTITSFTIFSRNNQAPQYGGWQVNPFPFNPQYTILGSRIATSKDFGYIYGVSIINGKPDNYLRIWRNYKDFGWRLVLEVLRY